MRKLLVLALILGSARSNFLSPLFSACSASLREILLPLRVLLNQKEPSPGLFRQFFAAQQMSYCSGAELPEAHKALRHELRYCADGSIVGSIS